MIHTSAKQLNLTQLTSGILILGHLSPFLESNLDIIITFDSHKITVFVLVSKTHRASCDGVIRETADFGIDAVDEGLVCDVELDYERHVIAVAIYLYFQLRWEL